MGITTTAASRTPDLRPISNPEQRSPFRHGSIIAQLENDQFVETQGGAEERAFRRGHNHGIRHAIDLVRVEIGLRELAHAQVIRTVELHTAPELDDERCLDLRLKHALIGGGS